MAAPLLPPRAARWPLLLALALLVGCGAAPKPAPLEADDAAAVLAHVPADTPYLLASLADVPPALAEREVARLGQALQVLVDALLEQAAVARAQSPFDRLVLAAAAAVDGKLDGPGLEALGVGRHPRFALYGIAGLPALRARVADGRKIEALVDRVLTDAGVQVERGTLEGQAYRVVFVGDLPLLYLAFGDRWAVAGVLLPPVRDELLPVLLGVTPPKVPLTAAELGPQLAADGLVPSGFGWLKPAGLLTAGWPMTRVLEAGAPAGCVGTLRDAFGAVESVHLGSRGADAARTSSVVHLRLAPKLREDLAKSLRPAPGLAPRASGLDKAALAVGLDLPVALAALQGWGRRLQANPSACPWFSGFDRLAEHLTSGAWQRVVDGAPAVQGLAVVLSRLEPAEAGPPRVDAALWIAGPAQALFDLMGDAVPGAQGLAQAPPGRVEPLTLPLGMALMVPEAHGIHEAGGLGLAVGAEGRARLEGLNREPPPADGPVLRWHLEPQFLAALQGADDREEWAEAPRIADAMARFRAIRNAGARSMSGVARLTPQGLTLEAWTEYGE